jgi:hypothetical protein
LHRPALSRRCTGTSSEREITIFGLTSRLRTSATAAPRDDAEPGNALERASRSVTARQAKPYRSVADTRLAAVEADSRFYSRRTAICGYSSVRRRDGPQRVFRQAVCAMKIRYFTDTDTLLMQFRGCPCGRDARSR